MGKPQWKQMLTLRPVRISLFAASALFALLLWRTVFPSHVTTMPFFYSADQGSLRFRTQIAGQPHPLEFDTLMTKTALGSGVYRQLSHQEVGIDQLNPAADFALGSYRARLFYAEIAETELRPYTDGALGLDMFVPSSGFEGENRRPGARLTLDFKASLMHIEDGPELAPLHLPEGTAEAPLLRDADGRYYLLLPLNDGASYRFALGIGTRDVQLPTGSVHVLSRDGTGYANPIGIVPITLTFGAQDLSVQAVGLRETQTTGVLGMSLLSQYRVVLDFRNRRLYLEPANSPSDF
ncbi:MAG: hypothetical protein JWL77_2700 [Chthonomonadaceae bacterium]|nr:hypothetical protein [Chthonomonadaceae bacterium]